ncbi:MAG: hypothetical protein AAGC60_10510 [Acidobacteriota bacterium]
MSDDPQSSRGPRNERRSGDASNDSAEMLRASYDELQGRLESASGDLGRWVKRSPGQAILAGLAVGFLVGLFFRRRDS